MNNVTSIYFLEKVTDDPRFEGFALLPSKSILGRNSLDDDVTPGFSIANESINWSQPKLSRNWRVPKVTGRVSEFNDYPCMDMFLPVFSENSTRALSPILELNGELLPLDSDTNTKYYFYNITTIVDVLDLEKSKCVFWSDPPTTAVDIEYFYFREDAVKGLSVFRIPQYPMAVFVTNVFLDYVEQNELNGFVFRKVWPISIESNWRESEYSLSLKNKELKKNTMVVILNGFNERYNSEILESKNTAIDAILSVSSLEDQYFGSYEGSDLVGDELRLFFSCPDVDDLFSFIKSELFNIDFADSIQVLKRYGAMYQLGVKEILVNL